MILASSVPIHAADFEGAVGILWSANKVSSTPVAGSKFLGDFGNQSVSLSLTDLPSHATAKLSFDLFVLRTWDGNAETPAPGPDIWSLNVSNGPVLLQTTFNNRFPNLDAKSQAFPGYYQGISFPPFSGAVETNFGWAFLLIKPRASKLLRISTQRHSSF